jgi:hypothetical protein
MDGRCGMDAERFITPKVLTLRPRVMKYVVRYLPLGGCGVGPSGRTPQLPQEREFASLDEAKTSHVPPGFSPWIEGPDGFHTYGFGQWQFTEHRTWHQKAA